MSSRLTSLETHPRVLIVEDDPSDILILRVATQDLPWSVKIAETSEKALRAISEDAPALDGHWWSTPDFILMDVHLGREKCGPLLRTLRSRESLSRTPIVSWTSLRLPHLASEMKSAGSTDFAEKPAGFQKLINLLESFHARWLSGVEGVSERI